MKLVTAVIKPHKWEDVREALETFGVTGMTVSEVSGYGRQKGHTEVYRGAEYDIALVPKIRIEIVIDDGDAEDIIGIIVKTAQTGRIGDGKVWLSPIETVIRVRTGDKDGAALWDRETARLPSSTLGSRVVYTPETKRLERWSLMTALSCLLGPTGLDAGDTAWLLAPAPWCC